MRRLSHFEGLRGIACLQVVLHHATLAFLPQFPSINPVCRFLSDGPAAVSLFFLLSGTVLTYAYEKAPSDVAANLSRRVIRLGMPLLAACLLAFLLKMATRSLLDAQSAHFAWVAERILPLSLAGTLQDATAWTLLGYGNTTLFGILSPYLPSASTSVDGPIWSLHVELWGSVMMLALVASTLAGIRVHRLAVLACAAVCGFTPILLFVVGHVAAPLAQRSRSRPIIGCLCLVAGIACSAFHVAPGFYALARIGNALALLRPQAFFTMSSLPAALFIYFGVIYLPAAQRGLSTSVLLFLGRQSFAIYLLHEPLLLTVGVGASYWGGPGTMIGATLISTLLLASVFERYVDRPAIVLSRAIGRHTSSRSDQTASTVLKHDQDKAPEDIGVSATDEVF